MVKVILLNLLRSKYGIDEIMVRSGTVQEAIDQMISLYPRIVKKELEDAVLFINQIRVTHVNRFLEELKDGDEVILTHFVGGG